VEGSEDIIAEYKREVKIPNNFTLVRSFFEEFDTEDRFDAIEMGFVLEHVEDPLFLMKRFVRFLKPGSSVFIAVPNARSLHRLIGSKAQMLDDIYELSKHDLSLGHKRYFDKQSLTALVAESGLKIKNIEGIFLKPFSTFQLESLKLPVEVLKALCSLAVGYPEISNAIYVEATL
jgi:2-polyprenyl-3-methyl-5-hydroxy-6-metoxy-1,4-benzoquinol methylase